MTSNVNTMLSDELADLDAHREDLTKSSNSHNESCGGKAARSVEYSYNVLRAKPSIIFKTILVFMLFCGGGLAIIFTKDKNNQTDKEEMARAMAIETGRWFSDQLDRAILPLFSLALIVEELDIFHNLPKQIGPAWEPNSLPFLPPKTQDEPVTHRNVTGVCDNPDLVDRFNKIASTIKSRSDMEGVLVNIQLAPQAVVCMIYPMVNTEDFPPGIVMNNTGAWGHDLLTDPKRKFIAQATIPADDIVIAGPVTLRQCADCDPTVERAFIIRLAIDMKGQEIVVDDVPYEKWGFSVVLINWDALIERSDVYEKFEASGLEFQLTRTDRIVDADTQEVTEKIVVLAESPNFNEDLDMVATPLQTTNNEWVMKVAYESERFPHWMVLSIVATVMGSFFVAALYMRTPTLTEEEEEKEELENTGDSPAV